RFLRGFSSMTRKRAITACDPIRDPEEPRPHRPRAVVVAEERMDDDEHFLRLILDVRFAHTEAAQRIPDVGKLGFEHGLERDLRPAMLFRHGKRTSSATPRRPETSGVVHTSSPSTRSVVCVSATITSPCAWSANIVESGMTAPTRGPVAR